MSDMTPEEKIDLIFGLLVEAGAIELMGVSQEGEPVFRVTEKCKEVFPEFYEMHKADINRVAYELWDLGVIEVTFKDDEERISFDERNYERLKEVIETTGLTEEQAEFLRSLGAPIEIVE